MRIIFGSFEFVSIVRAGTFCLFDTLIYRSNPDYFNCCINLLFKGTDNSFSAF